jgi:hypothetical protein
MKYITIYTWNVLDEMKKGTVVYALDRKEKEVVCLNDVYCRYVMSLLCEAEKGSDSVIFWKEEKVDA